MSKLRQCQQSINVANIKAIIRGAYDVQSLRIQMGNRIVGNFKAKLGQSQSKSEKEIDAESKNILSDLRLHYKIITDGVVLFPRRKSFIGNEIISDYTDLCLMRQYLDLRKYEKAHFRSLRQIVSLIPIWTIYLCDVNGVGPVIAGIIISEIDISKAKYASSLHAYAGLDVASDGAGRSKRKEHLVDRDYTGKNGKPATRKAITFNPFLKTKLVGVLGMSFLKVKESPYKESYYNYKHRMGNHAKYGIHNDEAKDKNGRAITSKSRRHNMAIRYMIKRFLTDLYAQWRKIEGLPVHLAYYESEKG